MTNINEVKKNLFKIKKVIVNNKDWKGNITSVTEYIGVVRPYFDNNSKTFNTEYVSVVSLDGDMNAFRVENVEFKTTRITNEKVKKEAEKLIEYCKSNHKLQLEEEKLYKEFTSKKNKLKEKGNKKKEELRNIFNGIEKAKGFISVEDFIKKISKDISLDLESGYKPSSYHIDEKFYGTKIKDYTLSIGFIKEKISRVILSCEYDISRWTSPDNYDFIYEEYDRTYHIDNLDKSKDFEKLKKQYFSDCIAKTFKNGVTQSFDASIGDKDILSISRTIQMPLKLERKKDTYKDICSKIKYFISLV